MLPTFWWESGPPEGLSGTGVPENFRPLKQCHPKGVSASRTGPSKCTEVPGRGRGPSASRKFPGLCIQESRPPRGPSVPLPLRSQPVLAPTVLSALGPPESSRGVGVQGLAPRT